MKTFIIAEAGVNHNGSILEAKNLVKQASISGADAVKFQTFKADSLVTKTARMASYQEKNIGKKETQFNMLKRLELSKKDHEVLLDCCRSNNIEFLSTPFDIESVLFLNELGLKKFKISSGDITNYPYLKLIGSFNKEIILSTGMANLIEVELALNLLIKSGTKKNNITLLHATTDYPTKLKDVNLSAIKTLAKEFNTKVGYSDHTAGIEVAVGAVALGSSIIEKHLTLDKNLPGPDHKASIEPEEFKIMVSSIRNIEIAIGRGIKKPSSEELKNMIIVRKSIVAACPISKGELFTENNLSTKRPGNGTSPMLWEQVIGKKAGRDFNENELIII